MFETFLEPAPLEPSVRIMLAIWLVILLPWLFIGSMGAAMASEVKGPHAAAQSDCLLLSVWTYPILLAIGFVYRRKKPTLIYLPMLAFVACWLCSF